jgi:hypothetical protein
VARSDELAVAGDDRFACFALAFSPEGDELTALFVTQRMVMQLARWDFATGRIVQYNRLGSEFVRHGEPKAPECCLLPGRSVLLYRGRTIVDQATGEAVYQFPLECKRVVSLLDLDRLLVVNYDSRSRGYYLQTVALPRDEIVATVKAVRQDPSQQLPPLTAADHSPAKLPRAPREAVAWTAQPDPGPAPGITPDAVLPLRSGTRSAGATLLAGYCLDGCR